MTTHPTYPGRDYLATSARGGHFRVDILARATWQALDALAGRLDAIEARPQAEDLGAPCDDCGEADIVHPLDVDHAEDWQPQHTYCAPTRSELCPLGMENCGQPSCEAAAATAYPEPTPAQVETGRDLAGMAEADGAVSDGADVPAMIARALADAYWQGHAAGREYGGPIGPHIMSDGLPDWMADDLIPCAACPPEFAQEHDDNGHDDDDGHHAGHAFEPMPVHPFTVTFYVAAPGAKDEVHETFARVLDYSTANDALREGLDAAGCYLLGNDA